jgi:hypothetical protein
MIRWGTKKQTQIHRRRRRRSESDGDSRTDNCVGIDAIEFSKTSTATSSYDLRDLEYLVSGFPLFFIARRDPTTEECRGDSAC